MFLLVQLLILVLTVAFFYLGEKKTHAHFHCTAKWWINTILLSLNSQMIASMIIIFLNHRYLYRWAPDYTVYLYYLAYDVLLLFIFKAIGRIWRDTYRPVRQKTPYVANTIWAIWGFFILFVGGFGFFISRWFIDFFGNLAPDQFIFTLIGGGGGDATADTNAQVANYIIAPILFVAFWGAQIGRLYVSYYKRSKSEAQENEPKVTLPSRLFRLSAFVLALVLMVSGWAYAFHKLPLKDVIESQFNPSTFIEENYVDPFTVVKFPEKKRNFIHILMESVENSFYSKDLGGYDENNLMPDLAKLNAESVHFSHTDHDFGGPHQTYGASHSIAGMLNMNAGMSMKSAIFTNAHQQTLYPDFVTLGDLFAAHGYNNEIMLGANAAWGSLGDWYVDHGNFKVFDHTYAKKEGYLPKNYREWWGYEDDKLYEFAKEELTRLSKEGKPFYFILENADTHFPNGYVSKNMKNKPFAKQYANVIHYSQGEVVRFVEWIKQQDFYDNTTILITGDHRSMDKEFFKGWDPNYERTIVNMYVNSVIPASKDRMYSRNFAPFDLFPTSLAALGVTIEGERAGLGTNLFSNEQTLVEKIGLDKLNDELARPSSFYSAFKRSPEELEAEGQKK